MAETMSSITNIITQTEALKGSAEKRARGMETWSVCSPHKHGPQKPGRGHLLAPQETFSGVNLITQKEIVTIYSDV